MEIKKLNKRIEITDKGVSKNYPLNSLAYEKTDNGISILSLNDVYLYSVPMDDVSVDGTGMSADNADALLQPLFAVNSGGDINLPINISDVKDLDSRLTEMEMSFPDGINLISNTYGTFDLDSYGGLADSIFTKGVYTLSWNTFYVEGDGDDVSIIIKEGEYGVPKYILGTAKDFKNIGYVTFEVTEDFEDVPMLIFDNPNEWKGEIANIKLERGNRKTDWTPSSQDFMNQINNYIYLPKHILISKARYDAMTEYEPNTYYNVY